ncbi:hypothetical protein N7461_003044 [Penicillium sp. DV-2018c]|nr:hypothetical protein N7461_003044 [Penicillium sp. DV-2018c]
MVNTIGRDLLAKSNLWRVPRYEMPSRLGGIGSTEPKKVERRGMIPRDLGLGNMCRSRQSMLPEGRTEKRQASPENIKLPGKAIRNDNPNFQCAPKANIEES